MIRNDKKFSVLRWSKPFSSSLSFGLEQSRTKRMGELNHISACELVLSLGENVPPDFEHGFL